MHWNTFKRLAGKANGVMKKSFELAEKQFGFRF
jgi:hypothetical protein